MKPRNPTHSVMHAQRGVVLFVALIVMVAMSLAAVALIRSVDTTNAVIGNLSFRQASIMPANLAVENAAAALFPDVHPTNAIVIADRRANLATENYFASLQPGEDARGIPFALQNPLNFGSMGTHSPMTDNAGNTVYYMIERLCVAAGDPTLDNCDLMPPRQTPGRQTNLTGAPPLPRVPLYRVTIRVDGPQNTHSFLQAMLR